MSDLAYEPVDVETINKEVEDFMRSEMESRHIACEQLERTLHQAAILIEVAASLHFLCICSLTVSQLCYPNGSFSEKKNMALYNWYVNQCYQRPLIELMVSTGTSCTSTTWYRKILAYLAYLRYVSWVVKHN
jgi:hypothetical protein